MGQLYVPSHLDEIVSGVNRWFVPTRGPIRVTLVGGATIKVRRPKQPGELNAYGVSLLVDEARK